jgi:hypothetical protein
MAILGYTQFYNLDLKMLQHSHTIHPERCAKPSLRNLYVMLSSSVQCHGILRLYAALYIPWPA